MRRARAKSRAEPTIALINIVFLMLIFFMVSGTLTQPLDPDLQLVDTQDLETRPPPDALVLHADGRLTYGTDDVASATEYVAELTDEERATVRIVPDRSLDAASLVTIARDLRLAGAESVVIVTERALE